MTSTPTTGRRDRQKARTREALRAAARRLFDEQGYAGTTIEQIADAADVSPRTFFRYFTSKEDLLVPDLTDLFAGLELAIAARPVEEPPLRAVAEATTALVRLARDGGPLGSVTQLDPTDPTVVNRLAQALVGWELRLAAVLAERIRAAEPGLAEHEVALRSVVTAHVAVAAARSAIRLRRAAQPGREGTAGLVELVERAFAFTGAGCAPPA